MKIYARFLFISYAYALLSQLVLETASCVKKRGKLRRILQNGGTPSWTCVCGSLVHRAALFFQQIVSTIKKEMRVNCTTVLFELFHYKMKFSYSLSIKAYENKLNANEHIIKYFSMFFQALAQMFIS